MSDDLISRRALLEELSGFSMDITGSSNTATRLIMEETKKSIVDMVFKQPTAYVPEQEKIISKVLEERKRQDAKWGEQNHTAPVWGMIIGEEYGEMCKAINEFGFNPTLEKEQDIYTEAIHAMASCMAMIECIERQRKQEGVED